MVMWSLSQTGGFPFAYSSSLQYEDLTKTRPHKQGHLCQQE